MKILNISPTFPFCICGVGDYSYHFSKALLNSGHKVTVITADKQEIKDKQNGIKILKIIKNWNIKNILQIVKEIKEENPDVIYIQFVQYLYNRYGITFNLIILLIINKIYLRKRTIIIFHEIYMKWTLHPLKFLLAIYQRLQAFFLFSLSDIGIVTSEKRRLHLKRLFFQSKIHYVPVGSNITFKELTPIEKVELIKKIKAGNSIILGTFGKLDYVDKDIQTLFHAIAKLYYYKKKNIFLLLIGGFKKESISKKLVFDELIEKLKIKDIVFFTGYLPHEEASMYLQLMDIFISPILDGPTTRRTTLITAYAHSLPVVAFSGAENAEIFKNGENILMSKPDATDLVDKIELLIDNKNLRTALKNNAKKLWEENFTWDIITEKILSLTHILFRSNNHMSP